MAVSLFLSLSITATYFYVDSLYGYGIDGDNINSVVYLAFLYVRIFFLLQWLNVKVCFGSRCLKFSSKRKTNLRDRSLFITWGRGVGGGKAENFRGDHLIFRRTKGGINQN